VEKENSLKQEFTERHTFWNTASMIVLCMHRFASREYVPVTNKEPDKTRTKENILSRICDSKSQEV
jgi:hypothetical protein